MNTVDRKSNPLEVPRCVRCKQPIVTRSSTCARCDATLTDLFGALPSGPPAGESVYRTAHPQPSNEAPRFDPLPAPRGHALLSANGVTGLCFVVLGVGLTAASHAEAIHAGKGQYVVFTGLIAIGLQRLFQAFVLRD